MKFIMNKITVFYFQYILNPYRNIDKDIKGSLWLLIILLCGCLCISYKRWRYSATLVPSAYAVNTIYAVNADKDETNACKPGHNIDKQISFPSSEKSYVAVTQLQLYISFHIFHIFLP